MKANMSKRLVPGVLTAAAMMTAVVALPPTGATAEAAAPVTTLVFDKNPADPTRSTLSVYKGASPSRNRSGPGPASVSRTSVSATRDGFRTATGRSS